ncbi:MAG: hypothetical protein ACQCN6_09845 [Candidatus Bathyarchaeia archaeon]|jgi:hypothetical protein
MKQKKLSDNHLKKVLNDLKDFGVIVELDCKTYDVLGVNCHKKAILRHSTSNL